MNLYIITRDFYTAVKDSDILLDIDSSLLFDSNGHDINFIKSIDLQGEEICHFVKASSIKEAFEMIRKIEGLKENE